MTFEEMNKFFEDLRKNEVVICPSCEQGKMEPIGGDRKSTHCFKCTSCGKMYNIN